MVHGPDTANFLYVDLSRVRNDIDADLASCYYVTADNLMILTCRADFDESFSPQNIALVARACKPHLRHSKLDFHSVI